MGFPDDNSAKRRTHLRLVRRQGWSESSRRRCQGLRKDRPSPSSSTTEERPSRHGSHTRWHAWRNIDHGGACRHFVSRDVVNTQTQQECLGTKALVLDLANTGMHSTTDSIVGVLFAVPRNSLTIGLPRPTSHSSVCSQISFLFSFLIGMIKKEKYENGNGKPKLTKRVNELQDPPRSRRQPAACRHSASVRVLHPPAGGRVEVGVRPAALPASVLHPLAIPPAFPPAGGPRPGPSADGPPRGSCRR